MSQEHDWIRQSVHAHVSACMPTSAYFLNKFPCKFIRFVCERVCWYMLISNVWGCLRVCVSECESVHVGNYCALGSQLPSQSIGRVSNWCQFPSRGHLNKTDMRMEHPMPPLNCPWQCQMHSIGLWTRVQFPWPPTYNLEKYYTGTWGKNSSLKSIYFKASLYIYILHIFEESYKTNLT